MAALPDATRNEIRAINTWQMQRIQLIQRIAQDALENLNRTANIGIGDLAATLDHRLTDELSPDDETSSEFGSTTNETLNPEEENDQSDETRSCAGASQISSTWSSTDVDGQGLMLKQTIRQSFECYRDSNHGVIACHANELTYVDWVLQPDGQGMNEMTVASIENPDLIRRIQFPYELDQMRVVDMEYVPFLSSYLFAITTRGTPGSRQSLLYRFDSTNDSFQSWIRFSDDNFGLVNRLCSSNQRRIIYFLVNAFGQNRLIILDESGKQIDRKSIDELPINVRDSRLTDLAVIPSTYRLALAYNASTPTGVTNRIGICIIDPRDWSRISSIDLGSAQMMYTVPRVAWLHQQDMFAIVNHEHEHVIFCNADGQVVGRRSFAHYIEEYEPPNLNPINICPSIGEDWIVFRYTRVINIHRIFR